MYISELKNTWFDFTLNFVGEYSRNTSSKFKFIPFLCLDVVRQPVASASSEVPQGIPSSLPGSSDKPNNKEKIHTQNHYIVILDCYSREPLQFTIKFSEISIQYIFFQIQLFTESCSSININKPLNK